MGRDPDSLKSRGVEKRIHCTEYPPCDLGPGFSSGVGDVRVRDAIGFPSRYQLFAETTLDLLAGHALCLPEMRLSESDVAMEGYSKCPGDDLRCFERAAKVAAHDRFDALSLKLRDQQPGLGSALVIQGDVDVPLKTLLGVPVGFTMSEDVDFLHPATFN